MKATYLTPAPHVATYVQEILVLEHFQVSTPFVLPLFANGTPTLLFQTARGQLGHQANHLTLFGQTVFPGKLTLNEDFTLIAYFFKPYALHALFGIQAQELTDNPIDMNLLPVSMRAGLQEQLLNAASTMEMLELLNHYIFSLITRINTDLRIVQYAVEKITSSPSRTNLAAVQQELHITTRTFQRLFEKSIGIMPTQFRRISQFNAAFQQVNRGQFKSLTDVAYHNGYADQSHYIRAFKEFTGFTPKEYLGGF
jgi:AraC-like DNA-binding protein